MAARRMWVLLPLLLLGQPVGGLGLEGLAILPDDPGRAVGERPQAEGVRPTCFVPPDVLDCAWTRHE